MAGYRDIDLRAAINAISDVIQNRPRPIRTFDQIYMKAGDMVLQSELVAKWTDGKRLAFIGDGDAISVCVAYLKNSKIFDYGPSNNWGQSKLIRDENKN
ncbi:bis-aminopropyl spermidine synthase family protein [Methylophilus sp.]|jgi:predicted methyltransferase|uniref:bis-aminopropyl spermidine synthase family protein n=1 Tax=Methylophilus sp. TaxID=29541 RepID=UPI0011DAAC2F|nr:bis-aminopropyl spermidine synthase family protein [Methylophilus sp.]TXI45968.1 MAG: putative methyltransferase [Methylophilus sp.]